MSYEDCRFCDPGALCCWCLVQSMQDSGQLKKEFEQDFQQGVTEAAQSLGLVPEALLEEWWDNNLVADVFTSCERKGLAREEALVLCIKALVVQNDSLFKQVVGLSNIRSAILGTKGTGYRMKWEVLEKMCEDLEEKGETK